MLLGGPFVVLIFVCSISEGNFHRLKTPQIVADTLRIIFSITHVSVSDCGRHLVLWFPCTQKTVCCCWQWEVNKRGGGGVGGGGGLVARQILLRPVGEATQPKLLSLLSCETAAAFKAVLRRDWQQLQLSLSHSVRREPLNGKPREKEWTPPPHPPTCLHHLHLTCSETHLPPALGDGCLLWVMCHYDSSANQCYTGLWQTVEF